MKKLLYMALAIAVPFVFASCDDEEDEKYKNPIISDASVVKLEGGSGGSQAKNSVYFDFSSSVQQSVERISWHLGFNCSSEFGVILNNTIGSRAALASNDIGMNTVITQTSHDEYKQALSLGMGKGSFDIVDAIGYDLSKTVIKENKIYIYDAGEAKDANNNSLELYKISVKKKDNNTYTLSYSLWNSSEVKTIDIVKKPNYNFVGVSLLSNTLLDIQPAKNNWDIVWGRNTFTSASSVGVPFVISDVVFLNKGVKAAQIMTDKIRYDDYKIENALLTTFSSDIDVIGTNWRVSRVNTETMSTVITAATDRFYVINDSDGNYYKFRFLSVSSDDSGERGRPEIEYSILK